LAGLSGLVKQGNELLSDLLAHLAELDGRRLYLELGFASLFAYCTEELGMCESSAGRRILAARVCRKFPAAFARVGRGELNLSALCAMSPHLNAENAEQLAGLCARRSRREIEALLAARFPRPDVRDSVRRIEALAVDRFGVHFTADSEFCELLERARALASHRLPKGEIAAVLKLGLKAFIHDTENRRFAVGRESRRKVAERPGLRDAAGTNGSARVWGADAGAVERTPPESRAPGADAGAVERRPVESRPPGAASRAVEGPSAEARVDSHPPGGRAQGGRPKRSRYVPGAVARDVYARDQGQCSFVSPDGRRCGCRAFLELDHTIPWAVGGASTAANLRLRCRAHNQAAARRYFGSERISRAIAARALSLP
jgi:5-methylcytosine-specific restriction endonuclease McrA